MGRQIRRKRGRPKLGKGEAKPRIVPVRFSPKDLALIRETARNGDIPPSRWIRFTIKAALKKRNMEGDSGSMAETRNATYEQQIELGKDIVRRVIANLAKACCKTSLLQNSDTSNSVGRARNFVGKSDSMIAFGF
jgi:hypothetical protein